jgi:hypothetical protein
MSRADRSAAADRAVGKEREPERADPKARPGATSNTQSDATPKRSPAETSEPSPGSQTESTSASGDDSATDADLKAAIGALLEKGDLGEIAKKVGKDPKVVDISSAKLRLGRKRESEADAKMAEATEMRDAARREYGAPHKAREAYDKGDFHEAAQWISQALGDDFAAITRNVANATKGMNETELKKFQKERELKQREAALEAREKKQQAEVTQAERDGRALKAVSAKCAGHDALKLRGGDRLIKAVLEQHFNPATGVIGIGYRQAADQVLAEFLENARALGLAKPSSEPAKQEAIPPEPAPKTRARREFPADKTPGADADGQKTRGSSLAERQARAQRAFERGRP